MKKDLIPAMTSGPTATHAALKNPEVRPSGPGDLLGLSLCSVDVISAVSGLEDNNTCDCCGHLYSERLWNQETEEEDGGGLTGARMF